MVRIFNPGNPVVFVCCTQDRSKTYSFPIFQFRREKGAVGRQTYDAFIAITDLDNQNGCTRHGQLDFDETVL